MGDNDRIKFKKYSITTSAAGAASITAPDWGLTNINGEILAVQIDYAADVAATCDVTITSDYPSDTILSLANNITDGVWYPRNVLCSNSGTLQENWTPQPYFIHGTLTITVAQGGDSKTMTVIIFYR